MPKDSRIKNTVFNFSSSVGGQIITIVMQFAVRTVFIHTLGKAYLGIGGLFQNILSMLSLTEMGIGSAIVFKLYEPLAQDDQHRISVLMKFYRTIYRLFNIFYRILFKIINNILSNINIIHFITNIIIIIFIKNIL